MNDISLMVLKVVIAVCASLITLIVLPYINALRQNEGYSLVANIVEVAVRAAEQTITGSGKGAVKKEQVLTVVANWLTTHGIKLDPIQIDELIEAAVYGMKLEEKA
jgi:LL-H family phage holin